MIFVDRHKIIMIPMNDSMYLVFTGSLAYAYLLYICVIFCYDILSYKA